MTQELNFDTELGFDEAELEADLRNRLEERIAVTKFDDLDGNEYDLKDVTELTSFSNDDKSLFVSIKLKEEKKTLRISPDSVSALVSLASIRKMGPIAISPESLVGLLENEFTFGKIIGAGEILKLAGVGQEEQEVTKNDTHTAFN